MDNLNSAATKLMNELSFCVIDLETTGGNYTKDKIIEVGMVKVKNREIVGEKSFLVNPEMQIPDFIQKLTGISQSKVKNSETIENLINEVLEFIGDDIIVAHNTSFDVPFLNGVLTRLKMPILSNKVICTNVMTKHLMPEILNSNLNYMSRLFNIDHSKAHRAYDDALATAKLLLIYLDIFIEKGIKKVNQLYYPRNKFELDRIHFDNSKSNDEVSDYVSNITASILVTIKGERGLILAVLPLESPVDEKEILATVLKSLDWRIITIKLISPLLEGIFQFNNHIFKYPEGVRNNILNYLNDRYLIPEDSRKHINKYDFVLGYHLITDQIIAYSFLHLNTNIKSLFKVPAQKKKLYQYLTGQINKFETNQKGQRKNLIHQDLIPLVESILGNKDNDQTFLMFSRKEIKDNKDSCLGTIEKFVGQGKNHYNFPTNHL